MIKKLNFKLNPNKRSGRLSKNNCDCENTEWVNDLIKKNTNPLFTFTDNEGGLDVWGPYKVSKEEMENCIKDLVKKNLPNYEIIFSTY